MPSCALCSFGATSDKFLKEHMMMKHDEREFSCEICDSTIRGKQKMQMHKKSHVEVVCKNCKKVIPYNNRESHISKCVAENRFKCDKCDKAFNRKDNLKRHIEMKGCEITCNQCGKNLQSTARLDKHMASVHQDQINVVKTSDGHVGIFHSESNDLKCTLCEFVAVDRWKLTRHMRSHNPKPAKVVHKCPKCDSTFKDSSHLSRHLATPHRDFMKGNSRAQQYRRVKNMNIPKANNLEVCTESDIIAMIEKSDISTNQLLKLLAVLRKRFGRKAFEPNLAKKIREHLNSFDSDFETLPTTFKTKEGEDLESCLSKTRDANEFLNYIAELRCLEKPKVVLGLDGDVRHLMITAVVKEADDYDDPHTEKVDDQISGTSCKRVLILAKADGVPETRANVEIILNTMNLCELQDDFQVVCDLKMLNILLGIQSSSSLFGCPFCEACKIDDRGKPTNQKGEWFYSPEKTPLRTFSNIVEHANAYENEPKKRNGENDTAKTRKHKSVKFTPIKIKNMHDNS